MALGAQRRDILRIVIGNGMLLALVGLGIGLVAAYFGMTPLVSSVLFQVTATDPPTYTISPVILLAVALLACWFPAQRATRVDPIVTLRSE